MDDEQAEPLPPELRDDFELITDKLMGAASPSDLAEIERRIRRDPRFRDRIEMLTLAWNLPRLEPPPPMRDDRAAVADLWRRIREAERDS